MQEVTMDSPAPSASGMISAPEEAPATDGDSAARGMREWKAWSSTRSKEDFSGLVKAMAPTLEGVVKANPRLNPHLMRAKAKSLLLNAASTFSPDSGASFSTHVHNHLKPLTIRSHNETRAVAKGRFVEDAAKDYKRSYDAFSEENLREPTAEEMSDIMGISSDRSSELMRRIFSYEVPEAGMDSAVIPEDKTAEAKRLALWTDYVYQGLSPRDKLIMDYRLGRNGKPQLGLEDIARKAGISTTMAHKILGKISGDIIEGASHRRGAGEPDLEVEVPDDDRMEDLLPSGGNRG